MKKLLLCLLCFIAFKCFAQPFRLWGMTQQGGSDGGGVLFEYDLISDSYTKKLDFNWNNGWAPSGSLVQAGNGLLYGMTNNGGTYGAGVLFEYDPNASTYTQKLEFDGSNGGSPQGSLVEASNGKLYGMTNQGGAYSAGVLFEYDPVTNTYALKVEFDGSNGGSPQGSLAEASNGKLYGMTYQGGAYGAGVLFEYDPATNTYTSKLEFDGSNGGYPSGDIVEADNGKLYGMTYIGGIYGAGILFEYDPATNTYTTKLEFDGNNGGYPYGSLSKAPNGKLYAMTSQGGSYGAGVLFEYDPATDTYTWKLDFDNSDNGGYPYGSLSQAPNGKLYAMTSLGGSYGAGVLFEYDPTTDTYIKKKDFDGADGQYPYFNGLISIVKDKVYVPDDNLEGYLEANGMGDGIANNNLVLYANISAVTTLNVPAKNIADLTGIEYFEALQTLNCSNNNLTSLNINRLSNLQTLDCSNNNLTTLTISSNTALTALLCNNNLLASLDASNGNNADFTNFDATNNSSLYCIKVDDAAYSTANWTQKDNQAGYGNGCIGNITLLRNVLIDPILTPVSGTSYSISPALPAGMSFNTSTGAITGTPSVAAAGTAYIITIDGNKTTLVNITVKNTSDISARYVQYRATYSSDFRQVNVYEWYVYSNGINIAYRKPVTANSYEWGDACSNGANAVDGNPGTRYSSNRNSPVTSINDPAILTVNLSKTQGYNIDSIFVHSQNWTVDFKLYISEDGENWAKYAEANGATGFWPHNHTPGPNPPNPTSPVISSFSPTAGGVTTQVVITGTDFENIMDVFFGGTAASSFTIDSPTQITAIVAPGTPAGPVQITVSYQCGNITGTSTDYFIINSKIFVNDNAIGANNGSTWTDAFTDLQTAIDAAQTGDMIFVAAGTYQPVSSGQSFSMKEGVKIYGGFAGTETELSQRDLTTNISTLTGNDNSVISNNNNGLTPAAVLDGFTISGGNANNGVGAGMMNANASPTIINCIFSGNSADGGGYGGGMYNGGNSFPVITNCIFSGNSADYGGGMYNELSGPAITNCTFSGNKASVDGGAMYNYNFSFPYISNSILWGNSSGIANLVSSAASISYSLAEGLSSGTGNLDTDPQFVNPVSSTSAPTTSGDYHLQSCSPAINSGYNIAFAAGQPIDLSNITTDITGSLRRQLGRVDMGAYESIAIESTVNIADDNIVVTNIQAADSITYYGNACNELIAAVAGNGIDPVNDNTTVKVWIETAQPATYVKRHYEITPGNGTTGRITLYFTQDEFDDLNAVIGNRLPQSPADNAGIANIRIEKLDGVSNDDTGLPGSYPANPPVDIPNNALQIDWNAAANRWEISFDVTGFSGFFVKAVGGTLPLRLLNFEAKEKDCITTLQWTTAEETNVARFEIQQSGDGVSFSTTRTVNARNTTGQNNYSIVVPVTGNKLFYRLKMTDTDAASKYSDVAFVAANCSNSLSVYPNPATDKIFIFGAAIGSNYAIYDNAGRKVAGGRIDKNLKDVNLTGITRGVFYVMVEGKSYKIIKN